MLHRMGPVTDPGRDRVGPFYPAGLPSATGSASPQLEKSKKKREIRGSAHARLRCTAQSGYRSDPYPVAWEGPFGSTEFESRFKKRRDDHERTNREFEKWDAGWIRPAAGPKGIPVNFVYGGKEVSNDSVSTQHCQECPGGPHARVCSGRRNGRSGDGPGSDGYGLPLLGPTPPRRRTQDPPLRLPIPVAG